MVEEPVRKPVLIKDPCLGERKRVGALGEAPDEVEKMGSTCRDEETLASCPWGWVLGPATPSTAGALGGATADGGCSTVGD